MGKEASHFKRENSSLINTNKIGNKHIIERLNSNLLSNGGRRRPFLKDKIISIFKNDDSQTVGMKLKLLPKLQSKAERLRNVYDLELKIKQIYDKKFNVEENWKIEDKCKD
jgi:hypothetical protein